MKTILLVDDEYAVVEILATLLADEGYAILTASDGQQALDILSKKAPDAVITDQMMPLVDGAELFRRMQQNRSYRRIPVVLMSSAPMAPAHSMLPWAMFLQKPFEFHDLIEWLRKHLGAVGKRRK
ncbi:MAG: response regulator [Deltaproteobacteria bacterium]|nr:MAG: response regulator [Deltaproteobacteria bacterium]